MIVRDIIQEELEDWNEEHQDNMIVIYRGNDELYRSWVEDSEEKLKKIMDLECKEVSYYSEETDIYVE